MRNPFKYGPGIKLIRLQVRLTWPLIKYGKLLSNVPALKWLINPFFKRPHNELTSIPIHVSIDAPDKVPLPQKLVERLVSEIDDVFLMDECHCAGVKNRASKRLNIGCFAFGPSTRRIHPSNGRFVNTDEAVAHVQKAAKAGLIANVAHVWIDALAFQLPRFNQLLFMCFCDDDQCIYRSFLKDRSAYLDEAYKKLPGISVKVDQGKCISCGTCVQSCFVTAISLTEQGALIGDSCKGCGKCAEYCPENAISLTMENEEQMFQALLDRIRGICDLPLKIDKPNQERSLPDPSKN